MSYVKIAYRIGGSKNQLVFWHLVHADGETRLSVDEGGWNGVENNRRQAEKAAQHHARLAEQKLDRKRGGSK